MAKPPRILIGGEFFRRLREEQCYYADKTALIEELVGESTSAMVSLITRPRRFGKTLTMTMLREFFDIQKDSKDIFAGLNIAKNSALCAAWMNKYPVMFISLKQVEGLNFSHALGQLAEHIRRLVIESNYLLDSSQVDSSDKESLLSFKQRGITQTDLETSLFTLSHALRDHWGKPVILLIDEYDVPLARAEENGYYAEMVSFLRNMLGAALKTNDALQLAVLTGCLRISKESIFTGLNNFKCFGLADVQFADKLGFTSAEVDALLTSAGFSDKKTLMKEWYDGYRFGKNTEIYCPWDILQYVSDLQVDSEAKPQAYWNNSSGNRIVRSFVGRTDLHVGNKFEKLLAGGCVEANIAENLTYDALHASEDNLWTLLYLTGYLTKASPEQMAACGVTPDDETTPLVIPNKEVYKIFTSSIASWFIDAVKASDRSALFSLFWAGNAPALSSLLTEQLYSTISYYDAHEDYYHAFLAGMLSFSAYEVRSNRELGNGRPDIFVLDLSGKRAAIIEIKIAKERASMKESAQTALAQIEAQDYAFGLPSILTKVYKYGVAFWKKECLVLGGEGQQH
ncbi:MAG: AAA family ATPase [Desulfovibrionaceae bacterium]|nr:AAA family ATPase [Desulfovibrionaceae bacterium]